MNSFFSFDTFIALDVLRIFYIVGVVVLPLVSWFSLLWVVNKYSALFRFYKGVKHSLVVSLIVWIMSKIKFFKKYVDKKTSWNTLNFIQKIKFFLLFLFIIFFAELFYRLLFEYLIAFMQMREALVVLK